jgi:hypothetical protein
MPLGANTAAVFMRLMRLMRVWRRAFLRSMYLEAAKNMEADDCNSTAVGGARRFRAPSQGGAVNGTQIPPQRSHEKR